MNDGASESPRTARALETAQSARRLKGSATRMKKKRDAHWGRARALHNKVSGYYTTSIRKPMIDHLEKGKGVEAITYFIDGKREETRKSLSG